MAPTKFLLLAILASSVSACDVQLWGQCGGINYAGDVTCIPGAMCQFWNPYYSQCIPSTSSSSSTTVSSSSTTKSTSVTFSTTWASSSSSTSSTPTSTPSSSSTSPSTSSSSTYTGTLPVYPASPTGLAALIKSKGRYIGSAYDNKHIADKNYTAIVLANVNQLTCENSMKWDSIEQTQGDFSTTLWADRVVQISQLNGMTMRGHTLVWHSQLPAWVTGGNWTNATLTNVMINHVTGVMTKYKGKIHTWDVVNEALNDDGTMRQSIFYTTIGETYIDIAFNTAKAVDPVPILAINDYNIEGAGAKATGLINLVSRVKARGAPIEQIGIQGHLIVGSLPGSMGANWNAYAALGVSVAVTELDIRMPVPATEASLAQQATDYVRMVQVCLNVPQCLGITFWGLSDLYSWVPDVFSGQGAADLFDSNLLPKPAYPAIQALLST